MFSPSFIEQGIVKAAYSDGVYSLPFIIKVLMMLLPVGDVIKTIESPTSTSIGDVCEVNVPFSTDTCIVTFFF